MYDYTFGGIDQSVFIETAKQLLKDEIGLDSFIAEMIKTHFQDADIEIIQKMWEWAEYPMLEIVDTQYLIKKDIDFYKKQCSVCFKEIGLNDCIKCKTKKNHQQNEIKVLNELGNNTILGIMNTSHNIVFKHWVAIINTLMYGRIRYYNGHYQNHISVNLIYNMRCTDIIHSLWSNRIKHNTESITCSNDLTSQLQDLIKEVQQLKRKNEALEYQLRSKDYAVCRLATRVSQMEQHLPTEIVEYDYEAIKERLNPIRDELNIVQRTFRRIMHAQYKAPIAVLVGKN